MTTTRPRTAPAFEASAVGLPWYRRAWAQGAPYLLPNLVFLILPAFYSYGELSASRFAALIGVLALTAIVFLGVSVAASWSETGRWIWVGLLITVVALLAVAGDDASFVAFFNPFLTVSVGMLIPWRSSRTVMLGTTMLGIGFAFLERNLFAGVLAVTGLMIGYSIALGLKNAATERQLQEAEERTAVLAVAAERERIGRDLHDILGHSLTTIAIKADLASRLVGRDVDAAKAEIDGVATVARQALADVRATASGMREVRLASEIASARSVLAAAGIVAETPSAVPVLTDEDSELMGYVVREAVTNVLRHSGARTCRIVVDETLIEVADDGTGFDNAGPRSGLRGLEERLTEAGWQLEVTGKGGVRVRARKEVS